MNAAQREMRVDAAVAAPLRDAQPTLDEVHRARLAAAIESALDVAAPEREPRRSRRISRSARWMIGSAAVTWAIGVAMVVFWMGVGRHRTREGGASTLPPPGRVAARPVPLLVPDPAPGAAMPSGALGPSTSLVALRGERARATIGARVRLTLIGAGRVSVLPTARDGDIELALEAGSLLVDYDGHAGGGGTLRVRSPGAVTTVVGTLFAVEAAATGSRVSVARGRVRTALPSGEEWQVAAGNSWTSSDGRLAPIADALAAALAAHEADWTATTAAPAPAADREQAEHSRRRARRLMTHPEPVDLDGLYADAEAAMRARSLGAARRALETIAERDPRGRLGETALLDLARLALADGDRAEARRALARLPSPLADPALSETAEHLRCRAEAAGADGCAAPASR
jgi:ferric-dicitrate binding protein FerR (iron transport regulator)